MKIYLVRHGQTDWNIEGLFQGSTDIPLNETGRAQAREAAERLSRGMADVIICSTMGRARETAAIFNEVLQCPVLYRQELVERHYGEWEGTAIAPKKLDPYYGTGRIYNYNETAPVHGIEPTRAVCKRGWGLLDELRRNYAGRNLMLFSHGSTIRCLNAYFTGVAEDGSVEGIIMKNCEIREYEV